MLLKNCGTLICPMENIEEVNRNDCETNRNAPIVHPELKVKFSFGDSELFDGKYNILTEKINVDVYTRKFSISVVIGFVAFKFLVDKITNHLS